MADMTLCTNRGCSEAARCRRATTEPGFWQSYAAFVPTRIEPFWCDRYLAPLKENEGEE